jgi:hypothetical protein
MSKAIYKGFGTQGVICAQTERLLEIGIRELIKVGIRSVVGRKRTLAEITDNALDVSDFLVLGCRPIFFGGALENH